MKQNQNAIITFVALSLAAPLVATAQEGADETDRATQNPIADQIKVQFQNDFTSATGPNSRTQYLQNMIPTVPFVLNENWNLIVRTDLPIINQPLPEVGAGSALGIGDLNPTFYLSPRKPGIVRWASGRLSHYQQRRTNVWERASGAQVPLRSCSRSKALGL